MEDLKTKAADLTEHVEEMVQTYYELARVNMAQVAARAISLAIIFFLVAGGFLCIFLLVGIGLALMAGKLLHNPTAGYFVAAIAYILILAIIYLLRKKIVFPIIRNLVVRKIYDKTDYQL